MYINATMNKYGLFFITIFLMVLSMSFSNSFILDPPEVVYKNLCANCHGDQYEDIRGRTWIYGNSKKDIINTIKSGYSNEGMPGFADALDDQQIASLADFILKESKKAKRQEQRKFLKSSDVIQSEEMNFKIETLVDGIGIPWGISFLPNDDILLTERSGILHRYNADEGLVKIEGAPAVIDKGQGGLMDVDVHPKFEDNGYIYLTYSKKDDNDNKYTTAVWRAKLDHARLVDGKDIFVAAPYEKTRHHYGSRLEFDRDGFLYLSVGDRGKRDDNPQSLDNHCGKIHRIHDDGRIPDDNPFVDTPGAMTSIYSYGHRNPQGLVLHPFTGVLWSNEHGPRGGDEMNIIRKGGNYGWPVISYGINYSGTKFTDITHKKGMEQPEHYWDPSIGVCGLDFVSGWRYPKWSGDILAGSLRFEYLARLKMKDDQIIGEEKLLKDIGRVRDVKMGRDGYIYVTVEDPGRLLRIIPVE